MHLLAATHCGSGKEQRHDKLMAVQAENAYAACQEICSHKYSSCETGILLDDGKRNVRYSTSASRLRPTGVLAFHVGLEDRGAAALVHVLGEQR